uniref:Uncharacterized protein n=1 Tax=Anopheles melas TaxID=34690 RepID=A0A182UHH2_9DIPT
MRTCAEYYWAGKKKLGSFVPAYKMRQANSVKIAKIIAITVVLSSFILGSFILASSYLQAKQSCDQMQALDAVLNKELMLEAMQQHNASDCALTKKPNLTMWA